MHFGRKSSKFEYSLYWPLYIAGPVQSVASEGGLQAGQQEEGAGGVPEDAHSHPRLHQPRPHARHPPLASPLQLLQLRPDHQERAGQSRHQEVESLRQILPQVTGTSI